MREGATRPDQAVTYLTSHDVEHPGERRLLTELLTDEVRRRGLMAGTDDDLLLPVRDLVDASPPPSDPGGIALLAALQRAGSAYALLLTSVGIPMLLAGEEFGDVHDLDPRNYNLKMSDPVTWERRGRPAHLQLRCRVQELVALRRTHPALRDGAVHEWHHHPDFDADGARVVAYCRTGGLPVGSAAQVAVIANLGPQAFPEYVLPWPWGTTAVTEVGPPASGVQLFVDVPSGHARLSLEPFQVRVFTT
jgi:1,4-alpha-glucan branching enzyme